MNLTQGLGSLKQALQRLLASLRRTPMINKEDIRMIKVVVAVLIGFILYLMITSFESDESKASKACSPFILESYSNITATCKTPKGYTVREIKENSND